MLIVSQDKTMIVNIENIEAIGIGNPLEHNNGKFTILINTTSDNQYTIAEYKKEEKAKAVMQEIVSKYRQYNIDNNHAVTILPKVYEIPEE